MKPPAWPAALSRHGVLLGIGLGVLAHGLFTIHDAMVKLLTETIPVWEILFVRAAVIIAFCLTIGRRPLIERAIATPVKGALLYRGVMMLAAWLCYYSAAREMPLAQLLSLYYAAPLVVTLLAGPLLGEHVTRARWAAIGIGFVGVMFASDPFGVRLSVATGLVLTAAALWGYGTILMRRLARAEPSLLQILTTNSVFLVGSGIACVGDWRTPDLARLTLLLAVGISGGIAQFTLFEGVRFAPASVLATTEYTALVWAFLLGFAIWGDIPSVSVTVGAALILAAGLLLVMTERRVPS